MRRDDLFWIWLSLRLGENRTVYHKLIEKFDDPYEIYNAEPEELKAIPELSEAVRETLNNKSLSESQTIYNWCRENGAEIIRYREKGYPDALSGISNPPIVLYVLGNLRDLSDKLCVSIVGTRDCTEYGARTAYKIAYELATAGAVIVSGMAKGIDGVAAAAALAAGGYTIAVLGCGLATVYPKSHAGLMHAIARRGAVITEYPPFAAPEGRHFPVRNRIISGLSMSTLVVEAPIGSGALITARLADEQGRDLYATPGNLDSENSEGPNRLIQNGARLALGGQDMLNSFLYRFSGYLHPEKIRKLKDGSKSDYDPKIFAKLKMPDYAALARRAEERIREQENGKPIAVDPPRNSVPSSELPVRQSRRKDWNKPEEPMQTEKTVSLQTAGTDVTAGSVKADHSEELLASLPEKYRNIFEELPMEKPFAMDQLVKYGYTPAELMPALTMLAVKGLIRSLPGGLYQRC